MPKEHTLPGCCEHSTRMTLLPIVIEEINYLTVLCILCEKIFLINLEDPSSETITACEIGGYSICHGSIGTILVAKGDTVSVLDCSRITFSLKHSFTIKYIEPCHMCYVKKHNLTVLSSWSQRKIFAVTASGTTKWDASTEIQRVNCRPSRVVHVPQTGCVLLGDYLSDRILVLSGHDGRLIQTLLLGGGFWVLDLHLLSDDKLIVRGNDHLRDHERLVFYTVSIL